MNPKKNAENNSVFHIDKSNILRKNMDNNTHERTRWKKKPVRVSQSNANVLDDTTTTSTTTEQMSGMDDPDTSSDKKDDDTNYKNIQLPTINTRKHASPTEPFDWKPSINQTYKDKPDGLNASVGKTTGIVYLPSQDAEFIETTHAKLNDIITPTDTDTDPVPKPVRPSEPTTIKVPDFIASWKTFTQNPSTENAKSLFLNSVNGINELFHIPDLIAKTIVNSGYSRTREGGTFKNDPNYKKDYEHVKQHLQLIIMVIISLYAAFNWWFLLFYTDHFVHLSELLKLKVFSPVIWIIEPVLTPVILLNYYLLGKRTEKDFFDKYVQPVLDNKSILFAVYLIIFNAIYRSTAEYYAKTLKDIAEGKPNVFYKLVLFIGVITYMYKVVFDTNNIGFLHTILTNIILVVIFYLILFIFVMIACNASVLFIILFFSFYSYFPLLAFNGFNPLQVFATIKRIIMDTTEVCVQENPTNNVFITIRNFFYKYSTMLYFGGLFFGLLFYLFTDSRTFIDLEVRKICNIIYICIFLTVLLLFFFQINKSFTWDNVVNMHKTVSEATETPGVNYKETTTARVIMTIILIFEIIAYAPFIILDFVFDYTINPIFKLLNIFSENYALSIASFLDHGIFGYGVFGTIFRFLRTKMGTDKDMSESPSPM